MKHKPGKPHVKELHSPIEELSKALAMPPAKRRKARNAPRKKTWAEIFATGWPGGKVR